MEEKDTNLEENNDQIKDEVVNDEANSLASEENKEAKSEKSEPLAEQKVVEHFEYNDDHLAKIESNRNDFLKFYKKQKGKDLIFPFYQLVATSKATLLPLLAKSPVSQTIPIPRLISTRSPFE